MRLHINNPGIALLALTLGLMLPAKLRGAPVPAPSGPVELSLTVGRAIVVDCPGLVSRISTSNPEVVDAVTASNREVLIEARAPGQATLLIWSKAGSRTIYNVTVEHNIEPLRILLRETFPEEDIGLRSSRDSLALVGRASSQGVADRALALVAASAKGAVNILGALFKTRSETKSKTELIVVVTPQIATPFTGPAPLPATPRPFLGLSEGAAVRGKPAFELVPPPGPFRAAPIEAAKSKL